MNSIIENLDFDQNCLKILIFVIIFKKSRFFHQNFRKFLIFATIYLSIQNWRKISILINFVEEMSISVKSFYKNSTTVIEVIKKNWLKSRFFDFFF